MKSVPKYIQAKQSGSLEKKISAAQKILKNCTLCPRKCGVDRSRDELGFCGTGKKAWVSSFAPHFGEEPQLIGTKGSGTVFFTHCNLKCCFCQNYDISIQGLGEKAETRQLAAIFLDLQKKGCHNVNLVTPTHVVPQFLEALDIAVDNGLDIPIVYNTSGYDSPETLQILDGIIDIYMPDFKFWEADTAKRFCDAENYPESVKKAITLMHRQVGDLQTDENGIAVSGLLVRHLVLPDNLADTRQIMRFLKNKVSKNTVVNIMSQYRPMGEARKVESLSRAVTVEEFKEALSLAVDCGLNIIR